MATDEERKQAARRLKTHKRNLERLELRKAELAGALDLALENQIDEERANIAILEPIANPQALPPQPSAKVAEFARSVSPNDIDSVMLYMQGVQANARMTRIEEQTERIIEEQGIASSSRMQFKETMDWLVEQVTRSERARKLGARWYRRAIVLALSLSILALIVGCAALSAARS